jgi:membrane fusion protein (multidrug efflux system)
MIRNRHFLFGMRISLLAASVSAVALTNAGCSKKKQAASADTAEEIIVPVKATAVKRGAIDEYCRFTGSIDAVRRASIAPGVPAKIDKIFVKEGMKVKAGQPLVRMDEKQLLQVKIKYDALKADYERVKTLQERGSVTPQQFDQMQAAYQAAKTAFEQMNESTYLNAPFSGTIIGKYYHDGDFFTFFRTGPDEVVAILTIVQLGEMKIDINVPENDYVRIKVGQPARITIGALGDTSFTGKVSMVTPALDMLSRTAKISVAINNSSGILKPGMFASVKIITNSKDSVLLAPAAAVVDINGKPGVFVVPAGTPPFRCQATPKIVSIGLHNEDTSELIEGVDEGMLLVVEGNSALEARTKINVTAIEN